ncbi:MAG: GGDEF domain-containing protein [gamma proteobacterium symbiont of Ctena orbiculata]|nr:GGDEF domain-containing protein [Candidatus Thiodiazotropha taylori]MBT3060160.1 GGDEF domain-containing protein [Candidatus Thiodiazotropha sp. (ex Lucina pensylvanica)]MBV2095985.1 GGDEF domain-containing protein [Candidatus Thiodiazotropha sp. (ex Codakia orbicularis)]PUB73170.1 MAG: GGDEF domain-containing protein [gamma proteobacterium symbiont of Ctena orbiculata]MBT3064543.1 GGDEF domain-containing protein [Candidatus Thiodiazotropha sp. (ex Lucina pensylvanica)]
MDSTLGLVLELSGKLQTTLEVDSVIELFADLVQRQFQTDTLNYRSKDGAVAIQHGENPGRNRLEYDLTVMDSALGTISVSRKRRYKRIEIQQIENLLSALLYPLRNALLYRAAIESAFIDSLTGVKNRSAFDANFGRDMEFNRRKQSDLSLLVLDIDFFKRINDQYGHAVGDMVLNEIAATVERTIRSSDALYRYGGEEFVVVLNDTNIEGANLLAKRIRRNVERLRIKSLKDVRITLSGGVAAMVEQDTPQSLFERADAALYQAKKNGRNQVVTAEIPLLS